MEISVHPLPAELPVTPESAAPALAPADGQPLGALVGRPLGPGDGIALVGWPATAPGRYHLFESRPGRTAGPPTHMQVVQFSGPRTAEWAAAEERAASGRLGPATTGIDGIVAVLRLRAADNGYLVVVLAAGREAFAAAERAIGSAEPLPGEDPAFVGPPDQVRYFSLVQADLPLPVRQ